MSNWHALAGLIRHRRRVPPRGAVIAFVGPDGSGKSTLCRALLDRLCATRAVTSVHLGGPPRGTWLTRWPRVAVLTMRKLPRLLRGERSLSGVAGRYPGFQAALDLLTAVDRRLLVRRCHRLARSGMVVLTDRYPGSIAGSASGPRSRRQAGGLARALRRVELRIYRALPHPDLVVRLNAPVEVTVQRNAARARPKPERLIRASHVRAARLRFPGVPELLVDSTAPMEATITEVCDALEEFLASRRP